MRPGTGTGSRCAVLLLAACMLSACAAPRWSGFAGEPPAHRLSIGGERFLLRHLTESTWTISSATREQRLDSSHASTLELRRAVEAVSGCNVTDSDFSMQGRQFDAQVECPGALVQ